MISKSTRPIDFLKRAAVVAVISLGLAIVMRITRPGTYTFTHQLIYSEAIGLITWALIDFGRFAVHRPPGHEWPEGWRAVALPLTGIITGGLLGTLAGNALNGHAAWTGIAHTPTAMATQFLWVFLIGAIISYFFWTRGFSRHLETVVEETRREAAEAQLRLLQSQLEPHMLFNTLANLHVLIGTDPARAQDMLDHLIAYLRSTLAASRATQHSLGTEFSRTADYLALMQIRMGDRLQIDLQLPDALSATPVPTLLLQPLVENAIKHGLEPHVAGGRLTVRARQDGGELELTVRDTGAGLSQPTGDGTRFGLTHVRQRLATLYGDRASLTLTAAGDRDGGTLACVRLPIGSAT